MFADPIFWFIYLATSLLVGILGHGRRIGILGFFILALLLSPPIILLILIVTRPKQLSREARSSPN
jgi:hypothetical protein